MPFGKDKTARVDSEYKEHEEKIINGTKSKKIYMLVHYHMMSMLILLLIH